MCPTGTTTALTRPNISDFRSAFDVLDADHDGKISPDDLRTFYSEFSGGSSSEEDVIGAMMRMADENENGYVEYEEFEKVLRGRRGEKNGSGRRLGVMEEAFKVMDRDGDGKVGHEDLKSYLKWAGFDDATDEDIKAMIKMGGGDEHNGVNFDGLLKILAV